jgi:hypothetical protein
VRLRRVRRAGGGAAMIAVALLCFAAGAAARPGDEVRSRSLHLTMAAEATRGYSVTIETLGHHRVVLTAQKGAQVATYTVKGKVSRHHIRADLGRFGRISLRFRGRVRPFERPSGSRRKSRAPRRRCNGRRPQRVVGTFRGTLIFDGQRRFTRLALGSLPGEVRRSYRQVCHLLPNRRARVSSSAAAGSRSAFTLALLSARARVGGALTRFTAINLEPPPGLPVPRKDLFSIVLASTQERVGRVRVFRSTFVTGEPGEVRISRRGVRPPTAKVALKSPFEGSALYKGARGTAPAAWTGDLGVRLLGTGLLPLTGPRFNASLCRVSAFEPRSACFRRAEATSGQRLPLPALG